MNQVGRFYGDAYHRTAKFHIDNAPMNTLRCCCATKGDVFGTHSDRFPFYFNAALVLAVAVVTLLRRGSFTLGLDESYYKN